MLDAKIINWMMQGSININEIYYFIKGSGEMVVRYDIFEVKAGDVVLIPDGAFHQVQNPTDEDLYFVCVFDGSRDH